MNVRQLGEVQGIGELQKQLRHTLHHPQVRQGWRSLFSIVTTCKKANFATHSTAIARACARIKAKIHPGGVERRTHTATYYHTCPYCGANLDPGESCDCQTTAQTEDPPTENVSTVDTSERKKNNEYIQKQFQHGPNP